MTKAADSSAKSLPGSLATCQRGATAIEYALIVALIVLAIVGAFTLVAERANSMWNTVATKVNEH